MAQSLEIFRSMIVRVVARDIWRKDAVGNFCFQIVDFLRLHGIAAVLYAENSDPAEKIRPLAALPGEVGEHDILFYNFSIEDPMLDDAAILKCGKVLYYHGITPPEFFVGRDPVTQGLVERGLAQRSLATRFDVLMSNSRATAGNLLEGLEDGKPSLDSIILCPPFVGVRRWEDVSSLAPELPTGADVLLCIGRLSPHKRVEDVIAIFRELLEKNGHFHLVIVGGGSPEQTETIRKLAASTGTGSQVTLLQNISDEAVKGLYQRAVAVISCSRHEGFCVPVADALLLDRLVFCRPDPAMIEVAGSAAVLLPDDMSAAEKAALIVDTLSDPSRLTELEQFRAVQRKALIHSCSGQLILDALARAQSHHSRR